MMRRIVLVGLVALGGCGGGGTTGTNYSDPPPMAEIVATPSPRATSSAAPEEAEPAIEETVNAEAPAAEPVDADNGVTSAAE